MCVGVPSQIGAISREAGPAPAQRHPYLHPGNTQLFSCNRDFCVTVSSIRDFTRILYDNLQETILCVCVYLSLSP